MQLQINPIAKTKHYQYYFDTTNQTASRMRKNDLFTYDVKHITFQLFYEIYGGFPDPKFRPKWQKIA